MKKLAATLLLGVGLTALVGCDEYQIGFGYLDPGYYGGYSYYEPASYVVEEVYYEDYYYYDDYYYEDYYYDDSYWLWP